MTPAHDPPASIGSAGWLALSISAVLGAVGAIALLRPLRPVGDAVAGTPWGTRPWIATALVAVAVILLASLLFDLARRSPRGRLVERLVIVAVTASLALVVVLQHAGSLDCVKARASVADMATTLHALEAYRRENGAYPATGSDPDALARALEPTWIAHVPRVDRWSRPFTFSVEPDRFVIDASRGLRLTNMGLAFPTTDCGCPGDLLQPPWR